MGLIITSPPYANQRKSTYGGIHPDKYVKWFLPISTEFMRVLKPTGTFILNIREHVHEGERHPYVLQLILALRGQGWLWTDEFIWHKKNPVPGKWPNRFKNAWERLLQFNILRKFDMYQGAVMVPISLKSQAKFQRETGKNRIKVYSRIGSGVNVVLANFANREWALPSNVLHLAAETRNQGHSAVFPKSLPSWFIKLFTKPGDMVLDPFMGSETSCEAALELERHAIGIDVKTEYLSLACARVMRMAIAKARNPAKT